MSTLSHTTEWNAWAFLSTLSDISSATKSLPQCNLIHQSFEAWTFQSQSVLFLVSIAILNIRITLVNSCLYTGVYILTLVSFSVLHNDSVLSSLSVSVSISHIVEYWEYIKDFISFLSPWFCFISLHDLGNALLFASFPLRDLVDVLLSWWEFAILFASLPLQRLR